MSEKFTTAKLFYDSLLRLYPQPYRQEYAQEMKLLFEDLYQEEVAKDKGISLGFWLNLIWDVLVSTIVQHQQLLTKLGWKKYLGSAFSRQTFIFFLSSVLLIPFLALLSLDTGTLLLTGSREGMSIFYDNPLWGPVVLTVVLILPLIAVLMNGFLLVQSASKTKYHLLTVNFISQNFLNLLVVGIGLFAIFILFGHDFVPCLVNHTLKNGLLNLWPNIDYCNKYS